MRSFAELPAFGAPQVAYRRRRRGDGPRSRLCSARPAVCCLSAHAQPQSIHPSACQEARSWAFRPAPVQSLDAESCLWHLFMYVQHLNGTRPANVMLSGCCHTRLLGTFDVYQTFPYPSHACPPLSAVVRLPTACPVFALLFHPTRVHIRRRCPSREV